MKKSILCTFCTPRTVDKICKTIFEQYDISGSIFQFETERRNELLLTYVVDQKVDFLPKTILVHRKSETNTLYTINALNQIILGANNGILDKKFQLDWSLYRDKLLIYKDNAVHRIGLELTDKINN